MNKNRKMNRHLKAFELAYREARRARSLGPVILLFTRNEFSYRGTKFKGTLADYVEFCRLNKLDVRINWGGILG